MLMGENAEAGKKSLVKVIDAAPAQIPAPAAIKRALDVLKSAKKPLIILGKGAAYAQADEEIKAFVILSACGGRIHVRTALDASYPVRVRLRQRRQRPYRQS